MRAALVQPIASLRSALYSARLLPRRIFGCVCEGGSGDIDQPAKRGISFECAIEKLPRDLNLLSL
jgi:hypothetical protein